MLCRCARSAVFSRSPSTRRRRKKKIPGWILFVYFGNWGGRGGEEEKKRVEEKGTKYLRGVVFLRSV